MNFIPSIILIAFLLGCCLTYDTCQNSQSCLGCSSGYCNNCAINYFYLPFNVICSPCSQNTFSNGGMSPTCNLTCNPACASYADNCNNCTTCITGFYFINNQCQSCVFPCTNCTSLQICFSCSNGSYLVGNSCQFCMDGCSICNNDETC